jgi:3-hydroxyacyl-[acyl-carrier-protein] dehydratase
MINTDETVSQLEIHQILESLPHRYPFLLIDRILEWERNEKIIALKNVTANEQFFVGHFPERPVMPGVLILEALAQAGAILAYKSNNWDPKATIFYLGSIDNTRFKRIVLPGDQLYLTVTVLKRRKTVWKFKGEARTEKGVLVCSTEVTSAKGSE